MMQAKAVYPQVVKATLMEDLRKPIHLQDLFEQLHLYS